MNMRILCDYQHLIKINTLYRITEQHEKSSKIKMKTVVSRTIFPKRGKECKDAIDLDEEQGWQPIDRTFQCYFGKVGVHLRGGQLRVELHLKEHPNRLLQQDEIQMIERDQYELTQPTTLIITNYTLTESLSKIFPDVHTLARFLVDNIKNNKIVIVDAEKLTLNAHLLESNPEQTAQLYYNCYKKLQKQDLLRSFRKINNSFNDIDINFLDPDLLLAAPTFTEEELLDLYRAKDVEDDSSSFSSSEQGQQQSGEQQEGTSEAQQQVQIKDNISFASQLQPQFMQQNQGQQMQRTCFKQNQIPIYERFRGVDINVCRKDKIKLAEKMLRIGYCKQQIIRFFGGGADEMEAQGSRLPDYRNPNSARYKEIHMLVAKKQHQRHNQLLRRYNLPPVPQLPEYAGEIVTAQKKIRERRIKELLLQFVRGKKFKRLDQIRDAMRSNGIEVSLLELKGYIESLRKKSSEKKEQEKNQPELSQA